MDNGKVRIYQKDGIPVIQIYHDGELQLSEVIWIHHTILNDLEQPIQPPCDLIIDRVGSYSFSENAYMSC